MKRQVVVYCCIKEHNWSPTTNPETIIMYSNLVYLCSWKYVREAKLLNGKKNDMVNIAKTPACIRYTTICIKCTICITFFVPHQYTTYVLR